MIKYLGSLGAFIRLNDSENKTYNLLNVFSSSAANTLLFSASINNLTGLISLKPGLVIEKNLTWTTQNSNFGSNEIFSIAYGNNLWVAVGNNGQIRTSTDAITWVTRTSNINLPLFSVAYGNGLWVAGSIFGEIRSSTDAITWVTQTSNFTGEITSVEYGNGLWVIGGQNAQIRTSTDAITWVTQTSNFGTSYIWSLSYGNGIWVAGGQNGSLRTSTDIITWVTRESNIQYEQIVDSAYGNNIWVIVGGAGNLRTSTDTITWVTQTSNFGDTTTPLNINTVAYNNGLWFIGGSLGELRTSTDTITWVTQTSYFGTQNIYSIEHNNEFFVAGGHHGQIRSYGNISSSYISTSLYINGLSGSVIPSQQWSHVIFSFNKKLETYDINNFLIRFGDSASGNFNIQNLYILSTTLSENSAEYLHEEFTGAKNKILKITDSASFSINIVDAQELKYTSSLNGDIYQPLKNQKSFTHEIAAATTASLSLFISASLMSADDLYVDTYLLQTNDKVLSFADNQIYQLTASANLLPVSSSIGDFVKIVFGSEYGNLFYLNTASGFQGTQGILKINSIQNIF